MTEFGFTVDASVAVKWLLPETGSDKALALLEKSGHITLAAPDLIYAEVANAVWKSVKIGNLPGDEAEKSLYIFTERINLDTIATQNFIARAYEIAEAINHDSIYDCIYLACAEARKLPLVTSDKKFYKKIAPVTHKGAVVLLSELFS